MTTGKQSSDEAGQELAGAGDKPAGEGHAAAPERQEQAPASAEGGPDAAGKAPAVSEPGANRAEEQSPTSETDAAAAEGEDASGPRAAPDAGDGGEAGPRAVDASGRRTTALPVWVTPVAAAVCVLLALATAHQWVKWINWRRQETRVFRDAEYLRVFIYESADKTTPGQDQAGRGFHEVRITDRATIESWWEAMDYFHRKPAQPVSFVEQAGKNPCLAFLAYPVPAGSAGGPPAGAGQDDAPKLEFPIRVYADGRSGWGAPQDEAQYFATPELRDAVLALARASGPPEEVDPGQQPAPAAAAPQKPGSKP